jgi:hypothetical protein
MKGNKKQLYGKTSDRSKHRPSERKDNRSGSEIRQKSPYNTGIRQKSPYHRQKSPYNTGMKQKSPYNTGMKQKSPYNTEMRQKSPYNAEMRQKSPYNSEMKRKSPVSTPTPVQQEEKNKDQPSLISPLNEYERKMSPISQIDFLPDIPKKKEYQTKTSNPSGFSGQKKDDRFENKDKNEEMRRRDEKLHQKSVAESNENKFRKNNRVSPNRNKNPTAHQVQNKPYQREFDSDQQLQTVSLVFNIIFIF